MNIIYRICTKVFFLKAFSSQLMVTKLVVVTHEEKGPAEIMELRTQISALRVPGRTTCIKGFLMLLLNFLPDTIKTKSLTPPRDRTPAVCTTRTQHQMLRPGCSRKMHSGWHFTHRFPNLTGWKSAKFCIGFRPKLPLRRPRLETEKHIWHLK